MPWDGPAATRAEVIEVIDQLLSGQITRAEASAWAGPRSVDTDDEEPSQLVDDSSRTDGGVDRVIDTRSDRVLARVCSVEDRHRDGSV